MKVLAIGDLHCPAEHLDTWEFLGYIKSLYKPDEVVCLGDEIDAAALSRFTKNPDLPSAGAEMEQAIEHLQPMYRLFPKVKVCISNHTARPYRQAEAIGIPRAMMRDYNEILKAPKGWEWRHEWSIDGVLYVHGDPYSGKDATRKLVEFHGQSVLHGHVHSHAGVHMFPSRAALHIGTNVGCVIDRNHPAFNYSRGVAKPWIGVAIIENGIPRLIPMELNRDGRWLHRKNLTADNVSPKPRSKQLSKRQLHQKRLSKAGPKKRVLSSALQPRLLDGRFS